jgi:predicted GNAT family acetyltransferase
MVIDNTALGRFEIAVDGQLAFLTYAVSDGRIRLIHTEVPPALQGQGYASRLTRAALERAQREHLRVVPLCPFVRAYLRRHPEYVSSPSPAQEH